MTDQPFAKMERLGRFELLSPIGTGGMATIHLARIAGPGGFQRPVALKVILPGLASDARFLKMFMNEANIAAELQHRNIVQIYELGESDGVYFIAMEYLRGENVSGVIKRVVAAGEARMDARIACHIIMEACEGLHHAHSTTDIHGEPLKVVHRDVSPQNLFVTYSGDVKVMDFGIARAVGYAGTTKPGYTKGKLSYMAPEQIEEGKELDHRIDVYALGVVLWEMLAGRRLFRGEYELETVKLVAAGNVPLITSLRPELPAALDGIIAQALHRDRNERYQTAMALHEALAPVTEQLGGPVSTHELARWMGDLFPNEEGKKKALLSDTMRDTSRVKSPQVDPRASTVEVPDAFEPALYGGDSAITEVSLPEGIHIDEGELLQGLSQPSTVSETPAAKRASRPGSSEPEPAVEPDIEPANSLAMTIRMPSAPEDALAEFEAMRAQRDGEKAEAGGADPESDEVPIPLPAKRDRTWLIAAIVFLVALAGGVGLAFLWKSMWGGG